MAIVMLSTIIFRISEHLVKQARGDGVELITLKLISRGSYQDGTCLNSFTLEQRYPAAEFVRLRICTSSAQLVARDASGSLEIGPVVFWFFQATSYAARMIAV